MKTCSTCKRFKDKYPVRFWDELWTCIKCSVKNLKYWRDR